MGMARKLAAIIAADVVGYSRLMSADEAGTLAALKTHRRELIDPKIAEHQGRIVKTTGDGLLIEFPSVVEAVQCAVAVQGAMRDRNVDVPADHRIEFRVGINLGDIIIDGDDIYGDGVNVAARLEGLAKAGGICVSRVVRDQVRDKLGLAFADLGEQQVKNIARPVRVFRIAESATAAPAASTTRPALALPDKPSIAVLPFVNLSNDPDQEYFADGIVEDITTALSRIPWLFVIARNSSFTYKGRPGVDIRQVGRELGVRYALEGSVRKASNRVRITTQLIDATTGGHVWADHYDGPLDDIFELQDRITASVAGIIEPKLRHAEMQRARRKPTESLDAYDLYLRALAQYNVSPEGNREALQLLRRAIEIDPKYAAPYGLAARCYVFQQSWGWVPPSDPALAEGVRLAKLAASLGRDDPETLSMAAMTLRQLGGDVQGALALIGRALALNPNSALAWRISGSLQTSLGKPELAIAHLERSARLSPLDAEGAWCSFFIAIAHFMAGRYEEASSWSDKALHDLPDYPPALRMKAASSVLLGRVEEGRAWVKRLLAVNADTTISGLRRYYQGFWQKLGLEAYLDGLRKAGLPE
jgi:adenylate cyclase